MFEKKKINIFQVINYKCSGDVSINWRKKKNYPEGICLVFKFIKEFSQLKFSALDEIMMCSFKTIYHIIKYLAIVKFKK